MNQLANKLRRMGWGPSRITQFGQASESKFRAIEQILDGLNPSLVMESLPREELCNTSHLKFLKSLMLASTEGRRTLKKAASTFEVFVDNRQKKFNWFRSQRGPNTAERLISVYEMMHDGSFVDLFTSISTDFSSLCFTEAQIVEFAQSHRCWLRGEGGATFFLLKHDDQFFVARIFKICGVLELNTNPLLMSNNWKSTYGHRIVVPS